MDAAELRRQFYRDLQSLTQYVDRDLRQRITSVHANAKHISTQTKEIRVRTGALAQDTTKWEELADKATQALKVFQYYSRRSTELITNVICVGSW